MNDQHKTHLAKDFSMDGMTTYCGKKASRYVIEKVGGVTDEDHIEEMTCGRCKKAYIKRLRTIMDKLGMT